MCVWGLWVDVEYFYWSVPPYLWGQDTSQILEFVSWLAGDLQGNPVIASPTWGVTACASTLRGGGKHCTVSCFLSISFVFSTQTHVQLLDLRLGLGALFLPHVFSDS